MKRFARSTLGVTLLEIMLVLAIAANILVMSIRFYQSAVANQQADAAMQIIQGITAAADSLKEASGSYLIGNVNTSSIQSLMPNKSMTLPWGGVITITQVIDSAFSVTFTNTPRTVCILLLSHLLGSATSGGVTTSAIQNSNYDVDIGSQDCSPAGNFTFWYSPITGSV